MSVGVTLTAIPSVGSLIRKDGIYLSIHLTLYVHCRRQVPHDVTFHSSLFPALPLISAYVLPSLMSFTILVLFHPLGCFPSIRPSRVVCKRHSCQTACPIHRCFLLITVSLISLGVSFTRTRVSALIISFVSRTLSIRFHNQMPLVLLHQLSVESKFRRS